MLAACTFCERQNQRQAIRLLLGHRPGTDGRWHGWKFVQGELRRLRERLQIAEATLQHYTGAANEAVA